MHAHVLGLYFSLHRRRRCTGTASATELQVSEQEHVRQALLLRMVRGKAPLFRGVKIPGGNASHRRGSVWRYPQRLLHHLHVQQALQATQRHQHEYSADSHMWCLRLLLHHVWLLRLLSCVSEAAKGPPTRIFYPAPESVEKKKAFYSLGCSSGMGSKTGIVVLRLVPASSTQRVQVM